MLLAFGSSPVHLFTRPLVPLCRLRLTERGLYPLSQPPVAWGEITYPPPLPVRWGRSSAGVLPPWPASWLVSAVRSCSLLSSSCGRCCSCWHLLCSRGRPKIKKAGDTEYLWHWRPTAMKTWHFWIVAIKTSGTEGLWHWRPVALTACGIEGSILLNACGTEGLLY